MVATNGDAGLYSGLAEKINLISERLADVRNKLVSRSANFDTNVAGRDFCVVCGERRYEDSTGVTCGEARCLESLGQYIIDPVARDLAKHERLKIKGLLFRISKILEIPDLVKYAKADDLMDLGEHICCSIEQIKEMLDELAAAE